jgi:NAD(P)-dependent dehydrogenase (short-subunit alcohol dehydrogenase family)
VSGVGSTEPPRSAGAGFAGAGAGTSGVGSTEPPRSAGAGFAGAGAGSELAGQVALVTGGSRGVGRAVVEALRAAGATVAAASRSARRVPGALSLQMDVTDRASVDAGVERVERELGPITLLVNNAGSAAPIGPAWSVDAAEWWADVEVSVRGTYLCVRDVLPRMLERAAGRVINVSSTVAVRPSPYLSGYGAAKAAVLNLTESLAAETAGRGVFVFAVTPGRVRTELTEPMVESPEGRRFLPHLQSGRWLEPELGAQLVVQLAAGGADVLSGRFLHALDDLEALVQQASEIVRDDLYVARLRTLPPE